MKAKGKLESLNKETTEQDNALFMANGLRLKPGMQCKHSANQKFLKSILSIQSTVKETLELLQKAKQLVERIFPRRGNALKRKSRKQKQNPWLLKPGTTHNDPQRPTTIHNDPQQPTTIPQRPTTIHNDLQTTENDLKTTLNDPTTKETTQEKNIENLTFEFFPKIEKHTE